MNPQDTLQRTLADIAARDGQWRTFTAVLDAQAARRELQRALAGGGSLQGLPVGVKDIFDTAALPTAYGSALYAGHQPPQDAAIVQAIRRAGGVMVGKTSTTEFAFLNPTQTLNPNAPGHTPGGSSAGSAAAVAAGLLPLAVGTQTGGSVIRPASYCGVVGLKPTYGALPTPGLKPFAWSLDTVGLFTRSVDEMARWSSAISGRPWQSTTRATPVFGIAWDYPWEPLSPSARLALETARRQLQAGGATVRDVQLPAWMADVFRAHDAVQGWEATRALADEFTQHADQLSPILRNYLAEAARVSDVAYAAGQAIAVTARAQLRELFDGIDVLLTPSAPDEAPAGFGSTGASTWNRAWTLLHVPCLNVPGATGLNGLPMGVQVIAPLHEEALCLSAGRVLEQALAAKPS
ncbi:amidase [Ramlibacter sp. MMS24-I3-19]|uniref:amidase n=1 Tax=Ramlibacter sp. MMS24-I3-19 TaxID=3416606 RepID=UPI003D0876BC